MGMRRRRMGAHDDCVMAMAIALAVRREDGGASARRGRWRWGVCREGRDVVFGARVFRDSDVRDWGECVLWECSFVTSYEGGGSVGCGFQLERSCEQGAGQDGKLELALVAE